MRGTANPEHAFWSKPVDADAGWIDDLAPNDESPEARALDDVAIDDFATSDRVFHELRDIDAAPATDPPDFGGGHDDPHDTLPPAASAAFDMNAVSDDLLPSWNLDLG